MSNVGSWLLSYLLNSLWQVPLLFAAGWLIARALRPTGAATEHRVWVSVLLLQTRLVTGAPARSPHAIGIFDTRKFERRLMKLMEKQSEIPTLRRLAIFAICVAFAVATCGSALALSMRVSPTASSSSQKAAPLSVSPSVMADNRVGGADPKYPAEAKKDKIQGTVILDAIIGKDGTIHKLKVVSGPKELSKSAADAVRTWKYKPYLHNGHPVEVETKINVVYTLGG